ncbi:MAG TPA: glycosyltransferase family 4 protein [Trebonia sp.]
MTKRRTGRADLPDPSQDRLPGEAAAEAAVSGLRVIIANWRDPWHPEAGGAERYAWEMARALTARGAVVRYLTARGEGQSPGEHRDGIEIIRRGGRFTVYPRALGWLLAHRRWADVLLDCQNGIPFFTPLALPRRVPVLCIMHHVHTAQFGVHFPAWMAWVGRLLEGPAARVVYRRHGCVAVSPSTVTAMRERLRWTGDIYLIPNGTPVPAPAADDPIQTSPAGEPSRLVWIGRLVAHKRAELLVPVAARGFTIDVIGRGPGSAILSAAIEGAEGAAPAPAGAIRQHGYLAEADKHAIVARSLLHLSTSQGEGWGLCVLEAAALGVPTVAYDVEGLRDAVIDGQTGWLVRDGEELADVVERAVQELKDPARHAEVAAACRAWAGQLSWERAAARMAALVAACVWRGSSLTARPGAWIVAQGDDVVVAEGPVLDAALESGGVVMRPATAAEHLLGEVSGTTQPADTAVAG